MDFKIVIVEVEKESGGERSVSTKGTEGVLRMEVEICWCVTERLVKGSVIAGDKLPGTGLN